LNAPTEKQKHDLAARLTDVMVAFEGSEAFREVVWVFIEELNRDGWPIGGQPFFGPPSIRLRNHDDEPERQGRCAGPHHRADPHHVR
jgi:phenylpyruvate tautomerase PptA (4-oxalocrotonate tautomerase family)